MIALFVFSFILLFLLVPRKKDLRLKACISTIFLFFSISHFFSKGFLSSFPENTLKNITTSEFFAYYSIKVSNFASMVCFNRELNLFCFSNLRYRNNKTYFRLLLLLSGDISLNPGPINGSQQHNYDQWAVFKKIGLHFVHINVNSLLPKTDELRYIAKLSEAAVIDISESKLDDSVLSSEIQIENYDLIRSDRNRHGGGVACFIRSDFSYNTKSFVPSEIKNTFIEIFLPHSKPRVVGTIYHPQSQGIFNKTITEHFSRMNTSDTEIYILGYFNINLFSK